jgi:hypothetical protein
VAYGFFRSISYAARALLAGAVSAAKERAVGFDSVTNHFTTAVGALRRHRLNCTLKVGVNFLLTVNDLQSS